MSKKKRFGVSQALSRGLSETIHVVENNSGMFRNVILPLSRIELDPDNPRQLAISMTDIQHGINKQDVFFAQKNEELERLNELAHTIKTNGVINPIVVYKLGENYRVVAGERRCLASILAGKLEIEARVFNEKPKGFELKLIQWVENTAREDLTLAERINNIKDMLDEYRHQYGDVSMTATFIKNVTSLSLPQATYYMSVLNAPKDIKQFIENGQIRSLDKAAILCGIEAEEVRHEALRACIDGVSLKELRKFIAVKKRDVAKKPHKVNTKRGRSATRINMGYTFNAKVVRLLVESVLDRNEFKKYTNHFNMIDWEHMEDSSQAFKKLIEILEQEVVR